MTRKPRRGSIFLAQGKPSISSGALSKLTNRPTDAKGKGQRAKVKGAWRATHRMTSKANSKSGELHTTSGKSESMGSSKCFPQVERLAIMCEESSRGRTLSGDVGVSVGM
ncbi:hypothetical protein SODALDRAFT_103220 [Sodiomyces alkalinus F11]|uniref:Uncharacterized protein n=1 Tax=Sodiomyces alkalinus (strain CBS 110278 / VKM F-3762 / F11) TaxID=1314773 RepID=A0A3N2Q1S7_SODAK|nr:hypothetical protein SODALDRAFT_103220 [Sodiomyces alkalinus F11]ROT40714.1 hypothetical protein SODALDRAFT_103220 [Sodiomyces alkalinus F11]